MDYWWQEASHRLHRKMLLVATCSPTPLLINEIHQMCEIVPDSMVLPLEELVRRPEELEKAAVLCISGHYNGERLPFSLPPVSGISLVILNMCRTKTLAKHIIGCCTPHVIYWPSDIPDGIAVDFCVELMKQLRIMSVSDALETAAAIVPHSERAPKLLSNTMKHLDVSNNDLDFVVLEQRGKSGQRDFAGRIARVIHHTAVKGWVKVEVGTQCISWRVGHWRGHTC